jgi:NAD(P)H-hydrate epimerase
MIRALSRAEVRAVDRRAVEEYGVPSIVLMENAGRGAAEVLLALGVSGRVVICCGKGNNGGDGFVIARHLDLHGREVRVLLFADPAALTGDARVNYEIIVKARMPLTVHAGAVLDAAAVRRELADAGWVVDALFGTGLEGPPRAPIDEVIDLINANRAPVLAVDIPSGLDADTGQPFGRAVRAAHTVTFVAMKKGFLAPAARAWTGQVHVASIGVPRALLETL